MGADQHIPDPDDRAELLALCYELYVQYGSRRKVREHLAAHPTTVRICGGVRHFGLTTIKDWINEARAADVYVELLDLAQQRADSNAKLDLLGAAAWEILRVHGCETTTEKLAALEFIRKIEVSRWDLLGLRAPVKIQQVDGEVTTPPPEMIATIEALATRNAARQRELREADPPPGAPSPGATVLPVRRHRPPGPRRPPTERTS